jgi:hypothetical protein
MNLFQFGYPFDAIDNCTRQTIGLAFTIGGHRKAARMNQQRTAWKWRYGANKWQQLAAGPQLPTIAPVYKCSQCGYTGMRRL